MGKKKNESKTAGPAPTSPFHNPFAALATQRDAFPSHPLESGPAALPEEAAERRGPARAVVRRERKGRGGKEVTVVEQLGLPAPELEEWLKSLKNTLGCGGVLEDDTLVLQGDQRERLPELLTKKGVRKVSVG